MEATLEATPRTTFGKNEARRLRRSGKVPAVLYGSESSASRAANAQPIAVDPKMLLRILHSESGENTLISLKYSGGNARVMVRDYQLDPITRELIHADLFRVAMDRALQVTVPILVKGEAPGIKLQGGILDFVHREIEVECLPADIPEHIEVDVSELMVGQGVRVRDVATSPKWKPMVDGDLLLVHVITPKAEEVPAPAEATAATAAAPAEPEVIKKGKTEKPEDEEK